MRRVTTGDGGTSEQTFSLGASFLLTPRPFAAIDDPVSITVVLRPRGGVPIFFIAQPAIAVGVEDTIARLPGRSIVGRVEAAAIPAIRIFSAADPPVSVCVPACVTAGSVSIPLCG